MEKDVASIGTLSRSSVVEVFELRKEPKQTQRADMFLAGCVAEGPLDEMVAFVMALPDAERGRHILRYGKREIYRSEVENLASRFSR